MKNTMCVLIFVTVFISGCDKNANNSGFSSGDSAYIANSKFSDYLSFDRQLWYVFKTSIHYASSTDHSKIIDSFCNNDSLEMFKYSPEYTDVSLYERFSGYGIPKENRPINILKYERYFSSICSGKKTIKQKRFMEIVNRYEKYTSDSSSNANRIQRKFVVDSIRNFYLDNGLDIKISVYGKHDQYIKFTYILFNDVWTYKFQKARNPEYLFSIGFDKITLTDGYDYSVYWEK